MAFAPKLSQKSKWKKTIKYEGITPQTWAKSTSINIGVGLSHNKVTLITLLSHRRGWVLLIINIISIGIILGG